MRVSTLTAVAGVYASYLWKNVVILLWFDGATVESLAVFEQSLKERVDEFPKGMSSVHIMVPGGKSMPSAAARAELSRIMGEYDHRAGATAIVIPGTGFWASALRGLVTAVSMFVRVSVKPRICSDFADVIAWLPEVHEQRTGVRLDPRELRAALEAAERAALSAVA